MDIDERDLKITQFFNITDLEKAVSGLRPCRVVRFKNALEKINFGNIVMFLDSPVVIKNYEAESIVYWRKVEFENVIFSYKFAILLPYLRGGSGGNFSVSNNEIEIYFRGRTETEIIEKIQAIIDSIAEELNKQNELN